MNAWFGRFARKEKISAELLWDAIERANQGLVDADLGASVIKQRIGRPGQSKSRGYRVIVFLRKTHKAFFVFGFPKHKLDNIDEVEREQFKKAARLLLMLSDDQIHQLIERGQLEEVMKDGKKIPQ